MRLGIDLGTTNSLAAVFVDGATQLVPNSLGHAMTPSAVSVDEEDRVLVGLAARERLSTHPRRTATAFKRWMGTERTVTLGKRTFRPEELSSLVLRSLKQDAESHFGEAVVDAVITVPAYFNEAQRKATRTAAQLAGLPVARLLNEPTAAGLAYGLQERADFSTFLVFDLGGGTFDVSVLEYFEGVVQVRSSAGDTRLGGEDFVDALKQLFVDRLTGLTRDERDALLANGALWRAAEQAKRDLSDQPRTALRLQVGEREFVEEITREQFEAAAAPLLARLRRPIERALLDARLEPSQLSEVILVGGATRMPLVRQAVARLFQRLPLRTINPDETIARGAALQAALIARDAALEEVVLTDVMPFSLGVALTEDRFSPIIERNLPVPVSRVRTYCTVFDRQAQVELEICQGESPVASENLALGKLEIRVPPLPKGEATIDVRLSYDANGLLVVDVRDEKGGHTANAVIRGRADEMSPAQIETALRALDALKVHPRDQQENRYVIERAKRLYEDRLGDEREQIQAWLKRFADVLDTQDDALVQRARAEFRDALDAIDRGFVF